MFTAALTRDSVSPLPAEKTTRTATATTRWLPPWTGVNLCWGARTTTRRRRGRRTTRPRARLCCSAPTPAYSPCTAWRPRRDPVPSRYRAAPSRCTITTQCTMTAYWTLCLLIWWTSALKKPAQNEDRERVCGVYFFSPSSFFWKKKKNYYGVRLRQGAKLTDWNTARKSPSLIFSLKVSFFVSPRGEKKSGAKAAHPPV